jgi:hypothetical protein
LQHHCGFTRESEVEALRFWMCNDDEIFHIVLTW